MRFAVLGSGSAGNALIVEHAGTRVMIDCGLGLRDLVARLERVGVDPTTLDAVLVTHEHGDHAGGAIRFCRRYGLPLWCTHGTARKARFGVLARLNLFSPHGERFEIGDLHIEPFPLAHDAAEPAHFILASGACRLGLLTDTGTVSSKVHTALGSCDALFIEANHDLQLLRDGPYPPRLQARVGGAYGHLSNSQTADALHGLDCPRLRWVVAGHLSEKNNTPAQVEDALLNRVPVLEGRLSIAGPSEPTGWFALDA